MIRKLVLVLGLAAAGLVAGCDAASSAAKKAEQGAKQAAEEAKEAAKDAKEAAKEAGEKAKELSKEAVEAARRNVVEPIKAAYPKIEEKIKGLSGDAAAKAKEKFEALKKLVEDFLASPGDSMEAAGQKLKDAFAALKKELGLE